MLNYFEKLELTPCFALDEKVLEQAYFKAQRAAHPDRFIGKSDSERVAAIQASQIVNEAYETLKHPLRRAEHLLALQGINALDEQAPIAPDILMEMMDLRERLAEQASNGAALAKSVAEIRNLAETNATLLNDAFAKGDYALARHETIRLQYLGKAMEEAHMLIYRLKAMHG